jgi:DNA-directed RNA polymerase specialized sigma24 family protein
MSLQERRARDQAFERDRALLAMRDAVIDATTTFRRDAGSAATLEAVDQGLAQLVAAGAHLGDLEDIKALWITCAQRRLLDEYRSADVRHCDATAVDEHAEALAIGVPAEAGELTEQRQTWLRAMEILSGLRGEQRKWAEAWYREVLSGRLAPGAQPRGLAETLGWTAAKTEKTAQRARRKMGAFVEQRQRGEVCLEHRSLLDSFIITANREGLASSEDLSEQCYEAVLLHIAGCEECFAAWRSRRRTLLTRLGAVIMMPLDSMAAAAQALADRLAGLASGAHSATLSLLQRVGLGGAAAAGGGAAAMASKTAAVCVGLVCAAGAGVGEFTGVLPPIASKAPDHIRKHAARKSPPARPVAAVVRDAALPVPPPPPKAQPATGPTTSMSSSTSTRMSPAPTTASSRPTPGDLPVPTSSTRTPRSTPSSQTSSVASGAGASAPTTSGAEYCVPGSLGC